MTRKPILLFVLFLMTSQSTKSLKPWNNKRQAIPGRIQCELYDVGGEGIAFHDIDSVNNGSGKLNPANGAFLNEFRMNEAVDISFTKSRGIDDNPYNISKPQIDQLYVGWTQPGEWINYSIVVNETGSYRVKAMYTANGNGSILIDFDNGKLSLPISIPTTFNANDTIAWRQWHHWSSTSSTGSIPLEKGKHTMKVTIVSNGNMNFDYLEFLRD